jgi:hypothetical protein
MAWPAQAQLNCGPPPVIDHDLRQYGRMQAAELTARTGRAIVLCPLEVQVEAWVNGAGSAIVDRGLHNASIYKVVPVPSPGRRTSVSKHWLIWNGNVWEDIGIIFRETDIKIDAPPSREEQCLAQGGTWNGRIRVCTYNGSPIIADMDGDGYRLTSVGEGVVFDLDSDGIAEPVAWTSPGSDEAFLVLDRNGNGRIDNGGELFGDHTPAYPDQADPPAANGFDALKFAEGPAYGGGRADGIIDSSDAVFHRLMLWRDANHNGISEAGELQPVAGSALVAISTDYRLSRRTDKHGNEFRMRAKAWWRKPSGRIVDRFLHDVWLATD